MSALGDTLFVVDKGEIPSVLKMIARLTHRIRATRIRLWAAARLRRNDAVILDTETTDLHGDVIQLSVIDLHGTTLLSTLIRPLSPISDTAANVHGITDADVAGAPSMTEVAPRLQAVTRDKWVLAYNAPFDREALLRNPGRVSGRRCQVGSGSSARCTARTGRAAGSATRPVPHRRRD